MLTRRRIGPPVEDNAGPAVGWPAASSSMKRGEGEKKGLVDGSPVSNGSSLHPLIGSGSSLLSSPPRTATKSCQDRTQEFMAVIQYTQKSQRNVGVLSSGPTHRSSKNEFKLITSKIGKDLANTLAKLEKLSLLTVKRSVHSTQSEDIEKLTNIIRQDLSTLNKQIAQVQQLLKSARSPGSRHSQMHANMVVVALQSRLVTISSEFKALLEQRNSDLKTESFQDGRHSSSSKHSSYNDLQNTAPSDYSGSQIVINMDDGNQTRQRQQQQQLMRRQEEDRSKAVTSVEQTIVELGGIFQQLAHMVKEQEETVQRIDFNIEAAHLDIDVAHSEIVKYFHSISSSRSLIIKILLTLIIFFILFVYFI